MALEQPGRQNMRAFDARLQTGAGGGVALRHEQRPASLQLLSAARGSRRRHSRAWIRDSMNLSGPKNGRKYQ
jgi:hypothetical protein